MPLSKIGDLDIENVNIRGLLEVNPIISVTALLLSLRIGTQKLLKSSIV